MSALIGSIAIVAVSRYAFETIELFREVSARLGRNARGPPPRRQFPIGEISSYIVKLHVNQLADEADHRFFNLSPTRLQLPSASVNRLEQLARVELRNNPEFHRLVDGIRCPSDAGSLRLQAQWLRISR